MPRFVVHYHVTPATSDRPDHWDLMLENQTAVLFDPDDRTLATWALESQPVVGCTIKAQRLDNHRAWFLDNEGPLSGGRGVVTRQMSGEFEWLVNSDNLKRLRMITASGDWFVSIIRIDDTEFTVGIHASTGESCANADRG